MCDQLATACDLNAAGKAKGACFSFLASYLHFSFYILSMKCNPWKCGVYKKNAIIRYSFNHFVLARKRNIRKTCSLNLGLDVLAILSGGQ